MRNEDIAWLGADELTKAYRSRQLSPVDVTRAILDRIDALNPQINAFCLVDAESAMRDLQAAPLNLYPRRTPPPKTDPVTESIEVIKDIE